MNKRPFVTKELLLRMAAAVAFNLAVYYGGRFLSESLPHRCLEPELDDGRDVVSAYGGGDVLERHEVLPGRGLGHGQTPPPCRIQRR